MLLTYSLTLTGKKEWIDTLVKVSETDDNDIFMYLRPCIEDGEWYKENWFSWNCDNWGTKWDGNEVLIGSSDGECIELHFDSVWSPPIALYEYLVENGWEVRAYYYEEGIQFCGQFVDGEDSRYEIPSKKEFEDREGVELVMSFELMDFISPLYDFYDTDEEADEEEKKKVDLKKKGKGKKEEEKRKEKRKKKKEKEKKKKKNGCSQYRNITLFV